MAHQSRSDCTLVAAKSRVRLLKTTEKQSQSWSFFAPCCLKKAADFAPCRMAVASASFCSDLHSLVLTSPQHILSPQIFTQRGADFPSPAILGRLGEGWVRGLRARDRHSSRTCTRARAHARTHARARARTAPAPAPPPPANAPAPEFEAACARLLYFISTDPARTASSRWGIVLLATVESIRSGLWDCRTGRDPLMAARILSYHSFLSASDSATQVYLVVEEWERGRGWVEEGRDGGM